MREGSFLMHEMWRRILETAPTEEIKFVLNKGKINIPGFRPDKIELIQRSIVIKTMLQSKNLKKITEIYKEILNEDMTSKAFQIKDCQRSEVVKALLIGAAENGEPVAQLSMNLISEKVVNSNSTNLITEEAKIADIVEKLNLEWEEKKKLIEKKAEKKVRKLETKIELMTEEVNRFKKNIAAIGAKRVHENSEMEYERRRFAEEREGFLKQIEEIKNKISELQYENERLVLKIEEFETEKQKQEMVIERKIVEEEITKVEEGCPNSKGKVLIVGNVSESKIRGLVSNLEYVNDKAEDLETRLLSNEMNTNVIMLSWTMNMAKQRKIRTLVPEENLSEFSDYQSFCQYFSRGECIENG